MKKWQKRLILAVVVLAIAATSAIFIFHDDSDLDAIEKEQVESADDSKIEMHNNLENSFDEDSIEL